MAGVGAGSLMNSLLKILIARPRPSDDLVQILAQFRHKSFPSGHVSFFIELFGFLFFLTYVLLKPKPLRRVSFVVLGALISMVGVSRVYMGAHWPSDVAGAYLSGGMWLLLMIEIYRRLKSK
jgi:undecaprenyl-diphosphatase